MTQGALLSAYFFKSSPVVTVTSVPPVPPVTVFPVAPHPRFADEGTQEVRPPRRPPWRAVLQTLTTLPTSRLRGLRLQRHSRHELRQLVPLETQAQPIPAAAPLRFVKGGRKPPGLAAR